MSEKAKIGQLLREISEETAVLSFHIHDHPKLLKIIELGKPAVPILLDHLREFVKAREAEYAEPYNFMDYAPWYAVIALTRITKANLKPEHAGRLINIVQDWFDWSENPEVAEKGGGDLTYWPLDENGELKC